MEINFKRRIGKRAGKRKIKTLIRKIKIGKKKIRKIKGQRRGRETMERIGRVIKVKIIRIISYISVRIRRRRGILL